MDAEIGRLKAIWRYPVKSLAGEALRETAIAPEGLPDDRTRALFVRAGHAREGKPYRGKEHNLLHLTHDAERAIGLAAACDVRVELVGEPEQRYFDAAPVSLIFDRWIAHVERALQTPLDPRRWRPNLYAHAAPDFDREETSLVGEHIQIGSCVLRVRKTIGRCVTTTYDQNTGESDERVLRYVAQERDNVMGVYCEVEVAGSVRVDDPLRLRAR